MGHAQVCRKHLRSVLASAWPLRKKLEAAILLLRWAAYPLMLAMALLMMPALIVNPQIKQMSPLESAAGVLLFVLASSGATTFYVSGQMVLHPRTWWWRLLYLPTLVSLSFALAPNGIWAALKGLLGRKEPFRKTPRVGQAPPRLLISEVLLLAVNAVAGAYLLVCSVATFVKAVQIEAWDFLIVAVALLVFGFGLVIAALSGARDAWAALASRRRALRAV
jgi:hypothetical protein